MNDDESFSTSEILQAEWADDQLLMLFADLAAGAQVEHVQLRTETRDEATTLDDALAAFREKTARAIQVRYWFEQELWSDTILPGEPTTKIIRARLPNGDA